MTVTYELKDQVAWLTMDDGKANAIGDQMLADLHEALDRAEGEAKVVVLVGRPGRFSAGFDLKVMQSGGPDAAMALVTKGGTLALRLFRYPLPVIGVCTGHAIAMGALMMLACDTRIGTQGDFKIGLNESAIGMVLPEFGLVLPRVRLDPRFLTQAVVQAHLYGPEGAVEAGFLDRIGEPEQVMMMAEDEAAVLAKVSGPAYHGNKISIRQSAIVDIEASLKT